MFDCSVLSKTCLNIFRPSSQELYLPSTSWKRVYIPRSALGLPWCPEVSKILLEMMGKKVTSFINDCLKNMTGRCQEEIMSNKWIGILRSAINEWRPKKLPKKGTKKFNIKLCFIPNFSFLKITSNSWHLTHSSLERFVYMSDMGNSKKNYVTLRE